MDLSNINPAELLRKIPQKWRNVIYVIAFLGLLFWMAWSASQGDLTTAIKLFLTSLVALTAKSNIEKA